MSLNDLFLAGAKPKLITRVTASGTYTYTPTEDMARCLFIIQAAGANGHASINNFGGGGGQERKVWQRVPLTGIGYIVGAAPAAADTAGSNSSVGTHVAQGGKAVGISTNYGGGKDASRIADSIAGGKGGNGSSEGAASGYPGDITPAVTNGLGLYSGGDSANGKGGVQSGAAPTGYGAGSASGATNATGGMIEIWDFGA